MKKRKFKLPKETKPAIIFVGLVALVLLGLNIFLKPQTEKNGALLESGAREKTIKVYFIKDGKIAPVARKLDNSKDQLNRAIYELLKGPTIDEKKSGHITGIPTGCKVLELGTKGKTAEIKFNQKLENYNGSAGKVETMLAQIVYTATDIPGINKVLIKIKGRKEVVLGGEGFVIDRPLSSADLRR